MKTLQKPTRRGCFTTDIGSNLQGILSELSKLENCILAELKSRYKRHQLAYLLNGIVILFAICGGWYWERKNYQRQFTNHMQ